MNKRARMKSKPTDEQPVSVRPRSEDRTVIARIADRHGLSRHDVMKLSLAAGLEIIEQRLNGRAA
jgi:LytS/YehU family sensor histidine kinase